MRRALATRWPAFTRSSASSSRTRGPCSATGRPSRQTSRVPRMPNCVVALPLLTAQVDRRWRTGALLDRATTGLESTMRVPAPWWTAALSRDPEVRPLGDEGCRELAHRAFPAPRRIEPREAPGGDQASGPEVGADLDQPSGVRNHRAESTEIELGRHASL